MRTFTIYLPLYAPLKSLAIGLDAEATIADPPPCRLDKPIICISKIHFYGELFAADLRRNAEAQRDVMINKHYSTRRTAGDENIHFVDGWSLVGAGEDLAFVDGVHPTSHGFALIAKRLCLPLRHVLRL